MNNGSYKIRNVVLYEKCVNIEIICFVYIDFIFDFYIYLIFYVNYVVFK